MFKNHPKGLLGAALSNMGERFGFYIMMAILTLFISAKFGLPEDTTGYFYSTFYCSIYLLALVGGTIADRTKNFKGTILTGIILMAVGYLIIGIPTPTPVPNFYLYLSITCLGLLVISFGNGLFKGNLQALVGQMYDDPKYTKYRDSGFQLFYMFINIGAFFAPFIAVGLRNWWLTHNGFDYNADLPELCHSFINSGGALVGEQLNKLTTYAAEVSLNGAPADLAAFCNKYLDVFNKGFQYAFIAAIVAMGISLVIYIANKSKFPDPALRAAAKATAASNAISKEEVKMAADEIRQRLYALFAVLGVVIFFWFSFHQNGFSLTYFTRDYINLNIISIPIGFTTLKGAELFQAVNPLLVVALTPVIMFVFAALKRRNKEPSSPKKIGIGMGIAAIAYVFLLLVSLALPDKSSLADMSPAALDAMKLTPWVMIGMYFLLTVAELFLSPIGLSFVSKVTPPHLQGLAQGCWLSATALGNTMLFVGGLLYVNVPLWICWSIFAIACGASMIVMFAMLKWLERVAK